MLETGAPAEPMLAARQLVKRFGSVTAVDRVDLTVRPGEIVGLLGPNGAGKTTTVNICTGLLRPTLGTVLISGLDVHREPRAAKHLIGYVPDEPYTYDKLTGREFITFMGRLYGMGANLRLKQASLSGRVEELLDYFGLLEVADNLIGGYSHGMKQKTGLCGVLIHDPQLLFLDEPTVGLDPRSARLLKSTLQSLATQGRSVVLCTHILEIAQAICHRVVILDGGRIIAEGSLEQLRQGVMNAAPTAHGVMHTQDGKNTQGVVYGAPQGRGGESLEDIFLRLTGGEEEEAVVSALLSP